MSNKETELVEYIQQLTDSQGVSVVTVSDGWVFTFNRDFAEKMFALADEAGQFTVFVKDSSKIAKN